MYILKTSGKTPRANLGTHLHLCRCGRRCCEKDVRSLRVGVIRLLGCIIQYKKICFGENATWRRRSCDKNLLSSYTHVHVHRYRAAVGWRGLKYNDCVDNESNHKESIFFFLNTHYIILRLPSKRLLMVPQSKKRRKMWYFFPYLFECLPWHFRPVDVKGDTADDYYWRTDTYCVALYCCRNMKILRLNN